MKKLGYAVLTFMVMLVLSCTKEKNAAPKSFQYEYYPLAKTKVWVYDVDSTHYNNFNNSVTNFQFQIKDSIADFFIGLSGDTIFRVERYKKQNNSNTWVFQKSIARSKSIRAAEETLDNQTFVRLIFPPEFGAQWNGNSRNNIGEQSYTITDFEVAKEVNGTSYPSTLTVTQIDENNLIREEFATETYAKEIGLINKEVKAIDKNISNGRITNGFVYSFKLRANN
ncbi:hypothetical protein [Pedobacter puniceum]|jgi:hypothetical protein|uniref:Uncharacterized protein n=1 Tax=Pedobacter puniceum TaxID=2666136 RepID=A0A7K0FR48_9SPHI|nr:hypothetical protein [Pedobacter puniceum]MRX48464.1 hypothetical protein [Pedobacter puniceum]